MVTYLRFACSRGIILRVEDARREKSGGVFMLLPLRMNGLLSTNLTQLLPVTSRVRAANLQLFRELANLLTVHLRRFSQSR